MHSSEDMMNFPAHITARCINREWFRLALNQVWEVMNNYLFFISHSYEIQIHNFVLMDNHFHLIAAGNDLNLSSAMNYFMRETSRQINILSGRIDHVYKGRFHRNYIMNPNYYLHAYKYVYRNPIEAGLSKNAESYPYSTLGGLLGLHKMIIPIIEDHTLFNSVESTLNWINQAPNPDHRDEIKRAMRRRILDFKIDRKSGRPSTLIDGIY